MKDEKLEARQAYIYALHTHHRTIDIKETTLDTLCASGIVSSRG